MSEVQDGSTADIDRTPAALNFARAYYAGALLAARHRLHDLHSWQRAEEAWQEYLETARRVGHTSVLPPPSFLQEQEEAC